MNYHWTGVKDVDREILLRVDDDQQILDICSFNKYFVEVCNDIFFRNRLAFKYPDTLDSKPHDLSWKKYYLSVINYIKKLSTTYNFQFKTGDPKKYYEIFLWETGEYKDAPLYYVHKQIYLASKYGYIDLLNIILQRKNFGNNDLLWGLAGAVENKHQVLIDYYMAHIPEIWDPVKVGVYYAGKNGDKKLIDYFMLKGKNMTDQNRMDSILIEGLIGALEGKNYDLYDYFVSKGVDINNVLQEVRDKAEYNEGYDMIANYLISKGAV